LLKADTKFTKGSRISNLTQCSFVTKLSVYLLQIVNFFVVKHWRVKMFLIRNPLFIGQGIGNLPELHVRRRLSAAICLCMLCAPFVAQPCAAATQTPGGYSVTDLGTLPGGGWTYARGINNRGKITGETFSNTLGSYRAFLYSNGIMTDLGTLGGSGSAGSSINDSGVVTGGAQISNGDYHAFTYSNGVMKDLGTSSGTMSWGNGINKIGNVTGYYSNDASDNSNSRAFIYSNGSMKDLRPSSDGYSGGFGINNSSLVTGAARFTNQDAFIYSNGTMRALPPANAFSDYWNIGYAINDTSQVTGSMSSTNGGSDPHHAFLYSNGSMKDLGTLGAPYNFNSIGQGINASGQVVGYSSPNDYNLATAHAFVDSNNTMTDLNSLIDPALGWILNSATGINDSGQIVGFGYHDNNSRAFLLTPMQWQRLNGVTLRQGNRYDSGTGSYTLNTITNNSGQTLKGPVRLIVTQSTYKVTNASGVTALGQPYFNALLWGQSLVTAATGTPIRINFAKGKGSFAYTLAVQNLRVMPAP
jgi:probable HAF family extracellular repeat protein